MNKKILSAIAIIIILIIVAVLIDKSKGGTTLDSSKEPVKVGAALMLTGPVALLGELQMNAISMALEKINAEGGINGRPLEIVIEDAMYDPKQAVSAYQALKLKGIKTFIIDGSPIVAATRQLVVDDGNFTIAAVATAPSYFDGNNRTCRIGLTSKTVGPAMSKLALERGYKKVAVLLPDNEYGRGLADEFSKVFTKDGGIIVTSEFYNSASGSSDYRTNALKIKASQPDIDAIVFSQILNTLEPMLQQMKEIGVTKPLISDFATLTNPALKNFSLVDGVEFVNYTYNQVDLPEDSKETKDFKAAYRAKYNSDPIFFTAGHYDMTLLLANALRVVGDNPQKLGEYISGLKNYEGITGTYSFDSDCEVDRETVFEKVVDGKFVRVN